MPRGPLVESDRFIFILDDDCLPAYPPRPPSDTKYFPYSRGVFFSSAAKPGGCGGGDVKTDLTNVRVYLDDRNRRRITIVHTHTPTGATRHKSVTDTGRTGGFSHAGPIYIYISNNRVRDKIRRTGRACTRRGPLYGTRTKNRVE